MPEDPSVAIGRLRWRVLLATRVQVAQIDNTGIDEVLTELQPVQADVQALGALTFWGGAGMQIDTPFTHRIFTRWVDYLNNTQVIFRRTLRRDGTQRTERFRVRRIKELGGRKRFVLIEAELEEVP